MNDQDTDKLLISLTLRSASALSPKDKTETRIHSHANHWADRDKRERESWSYAIKNIITLEQRIIRQTTSVLLSSPAKWSTQVSTRAGQCEAVPGQPTTTSLTGTHTQRHLPRTGLRWTPWGHDTREWVSVCGWDKIYAELITCS